MPPTPLIGRSAEIERLLSLMGVGTAEPPVASVLIGGDAGVGKSRLIAELTGRMTSTGASVTVGHCVDLGDSPLPYLPFTQILGRLASESPAQAAALVELRPALRRLMPAAAVPREDRQVGAADRADLFEAVAAVFDHLGGAHPTLWVIEDVHWADRSTREMITYLLTHPPQNPAILVLTYRLDDLHRRHPLRAVLGEWARVPGVERLIVPPLGEPEVLDLVRALQHSPITNADLAAIVRRADGNPFFVEELVGAASAGERHLPDDLSDLLLVRIDSLDDAARTVVRAASVAGRTISHRLLVAVTELDESVLETCLRAAVDANVIVPSGSEGYAFRHALLSEAVYSDLLPGERVRLHRAFAQAIEADPSLGTAADLARYARGAHEVMTALNATVRAGEEANALAAPDEALAQYEAAIEIIAEIGTEKAEAVGVDAVDLTVRACNSAMAAGQPLRALALAQDHVGALSPATPPLERARLLRTLAAVALVVDSPVDIVAVASEALSLVPPEPPSALRAELLGILARAHFDIEPDQVVPLASEALDLACRLGLAEVLAEASTTIVRAVERPEDLEDSVAHLEQTAAQARVAGEHDAELRAMYNVGSINFEGGRLDEALAAFQKTRQRSQELRFPWGPYAVMARSMTALVHVIQGDWREAELVTSTAGESPPEFPEMLYRSVALGVAAGRGDPTGFAALADLQPWYSRDALIAILAGGAAIDLHGDRGDLKEAVAAHDEVVAVVTGLWRLPTFSARVRMSALLIGQLAAEAARTPGDSRKDLWTLGARLAQAGEEAIKFGRTLNRHFGPEAQAWLVRLRSEQLRLRWQAGVDIPPEDEMVQAWQAAVTAFERFGHRFETARSQARLAAALFAAGATKDAVAAAARAEQSAVQLGAGPLLRELRSLPTASGSERLVRNSRELTSRELEVLKLIAVGRSNREIADQLFISTKTASVHVSNILAKLGAHGRTEAVAIAQRSGII